jgi:hypothetical protein
MIKTMMTALGLSLCLAAGSVHADNRMADCNKQAQGKKGDERKALMKACLSGPAAATTSTAAAAVPAAPAPSAKMSTQQNKMADCNKQAQGKKGDERKALMKACLSGSAAMPAMPAAVPAAASAPAAAATKAAAPAMANATGRVDKNGKALTAQQVKMGDCAHQGKGKKGDEYKAFMKSCLSK